MKTISSRQTAVIAGILLFANKILVLPSLLYEHAKADSVFILAILLLAEIANLNKITLSQDDLTKAIMAEARRYPGQEQKVFDFYAKNERALDTLRAPLFEEKVIDFVADNIKVNEKQLTVAELYAYDPDAKDNKKNK